MLVHNRAAVQLQGISPIARIESIHHHEWVSVEDWEVAELAAQRRRARAARHASRALVWGLTLLVAWAVVVVTLALQ